jgi:hypothetical protein
MKIQDAPSYPPTKGTWHYSPYRDTGNSSSASLKATSWTDLQHNPNNRGVRLVICCLLVGAGYLLFQIAGGFPPWAWRFLFDVLPRLQSLWAAQGFGILLPLIGLLLLSLSLLILWSLIILGISQSLVLLWSAFRQQERWQTDHDESRLILEKQAHLRLIPEQQEPEQHFTEDPEDEEALAEEQDCEELEPGTRPLDVSENKKPPYVWS